jgi:FMN phosphatase YigB (HAD superfamily)
MSQQIHGLIVFDLDDTLVDREIIYKQAQAEMLRTLRKAKGWSGRVPSIPALRKIELQLIRLNKGDHMYDYKELARALWLRFVDNLSGIKAARQAHSENRMRITFGPAVAAATVHDRVLNRMPSLRPCKRILHKLRKRNFLVLFPSGDERFQMKVVRRHRLDRYFDMIVVRKAKNARTFREVKRLAVRAFVEKFERKPLWFLMVGDRISQDIAPAKKAGFETIWMPGSYFPGTRSQGNPTHVIKKLCELSTLLGSRGEEHAGTISRGNLARGMESRRGNH